MTFQPDVPSALQAQLAHAERILAAARLPTPRDDALALLGDLLGVPPALLLARSDSHMTQADVETFARWTERRAAGEAIAHITGHLAFMGLDLSVERDTPLIPPGAQRLVEVALERARHHAPGDLSAAEIGTGSGAIALALATLEPRFSRIYAVDNLPGSLRTATANGARYLLNLVISWLEGDGLDAVPHSVDLIVRAQCGTASSSAFTGMVERASVKLRPGGTLVCCLDRGQEAPAAELLSHALPHAHVWAHAEADGAIVVTQLS